MVAAGNQLTALAGQANQASQYQGNTLGSALAYLNYLNNRKATDNPDIPVDTGSGGYGGIYQNRS